MREDPKAWQKASGREPVEGGADGHLSRSKFAVCHFKSSFRRLRRTTLKAVCLGLTVTSLLMAALPAADLGSEKSVTSASASWPGAADPSWNRPLNSDQKVLQLLNRITFGPRPGDVERVQRLGISAFLKEQLHPESISDYAADAKVAPLPTLSMSSQELAENVQGSQDKAQMLGPRRAVIELAQEELLRAVYSNRHLQ